jgi:hypothetical protein
LLVGLVNRIFEKYFFVLFPISNIINTNKVSFSRDTVVDEEVGPFHTSPEFKITEQSVVDKDSSVNLLATPPEAREDYEHKESSGPIISDVDSSNQHLDDTDIGEDEENSKRDPSGGTTPLEMFG